jgi:AcrR family transcriptional regulator
MPTKFDIRASSSDRALVNRRREHIARCATRIFVKKGYERATVGEIARACGMSKGNLYNYVGSKEDILYLGIDHGLSRLAETVEGLRDRLSNVAPADALREFMKTYYQLIDEDPDFTLFTYQETKNLDAKARRRVLESAARDVAAFEGLLRRGVELGEFHIGNITLMAHDIVVSGHMWAVRRWFLRSQCTLDEYIREKTESVLKAILAEARVTMGADKA